MSSYYGYGYAHPYYYPNASMGAWPWWPVVGQAAAAAHRAAAQSAPVPAWVPTLQLQFDALVQLLVTKGLITEDALNRTMYQLAQSRGEFRR